MEKVFVVIPVFNRLKYTKECLDSVFEQKYKNFKVILIDSASTDGTLSYVRRKYPKVTIIEGRSDWWWTRATCEGIKKALREAKASDYILALNNDCFVDPSYLNRILATARNNKDSIVGSLCVEAKNRNSVVEAGIKLDWKKGQVIPLTQKYGTDRKKYRGAGLITNSDALPGKGTLIPARVILKLGGFNYRRLPHYLADYEFTNRAKKKGYKLIVDPKAVVYHHWEATGNGFSLSRNRYSYKEAYELVFGRKSMNNLIDWINFVLLVCPPSLHRHNFKLLLARLFTGLGTLSPFYYVFRHS